MFGSACAQIVGYFGFGGLGIRDSQSILPEATVVKSTLDHAVSMGMKGLFLFFFTDFLFAKLGSNPEFGAF